MAVVSERKKRVSLAIRNSLLVIAGTCILAFGTGVFIIPFELVTGGVSGIGIILHRALGALPFFGELSAEVYASASNLVLFILGLIFLGRRFAAKTLLSVAVYPLALYLSSLLVGSGALGGFFDLLSERYSAFGGVTVILAAVFGGALVGAGCALTFLGGGSTGGTDIIALILSKYIRKLKSSTAIFIVDAAVILLGLFAIGNMVISMLGVASAFVCAIVVDRAFLGESGAFVAYIISENPTEITKEIIERLERTATVIEARGAYSGRKTDLIMVTFSPRQYSALISIISSSDPRAFVAIHRAHEINGEGWSEVKSKK